MKRKNRNHISSKLLKWIAIVFPISVLFQQPILGWLATPTDYYNPQLRVTTFIVFLIPIVLWFFFMIVLFFMLLSHNFRRKHVVFVIVMICSMIGSTYLYYGFNIVDLLMNKAHYEQIVDSVHEGEVNYGTSLNRSDNIDYIVYKNTVQQQVWVGIINRNTFIVKEIGDLLKGYIDQTANYRVSCSFSVTSWHFCYIDYYRRDTFHSTFIVELETKLMDMPE